MKIIELSTAEREQETRELFLQCKPYLDKGYGLYSSIRLATDRVAINSNSGWYRDLIDYCKSQGYTHLRTGNRLKVEERVKIIVENDEEATKRLYAECKPYLDKGLCLGNAIREVKGLSKRYNFYGQAWYKRLRLYVDSLEE